MNSKDRNPKNNNSNKDRSFQKSRPASQDGRFSKPRSESGRDERFSKPRSESSREDRFSKPRPTGGRDERFSKPRSEGSRDERFSKPRSEGGREDRFSKPRSEGSREDRFSKPRPTGGRDERFSKPRSEGSREDRFSKPRSEGGREDRFSKPRSEGGREDRFSKPRSEGGREDRFSKPRSEGGREDRFSKPRSEGSREDRFSKPRSEGGREDRFSKPRSEGSREDRFSKPRSEGGREDRFSKPRSEGNREDRFSKPRSEGSREDRFSKPRSEGGREDRFNKGNTGPKKAFKGGGAGKGRFTGKAQDFSKGHSDDGDDVLFQDRSGKGFSELPDTRYEKRVPNSKIAHTISKSGMKETRYKKDGTFKKEFEPAEVALVKPSGVPKPGLHVRNKHRFAYDFEALLKISPKLNPYLLVNPKGEQTLDFANPKAVRLFNQALLRKDYGIKRFELPEGYLCPPIPGRADYIHHLADMLRDIQGRIIPHGDGIRGLDIGTGASGIYPVIGSQEYGWSFVAVDTDRRALEAVETMIAENTALKGLIECRPQKRSDHFFEGVVEAGETFDFSVCNPPFYRSAAEARGANIKKNRNLKKTAHPRAQRNFSGQSHELWYPGGELAFAKEMINESQSFQSQIMWFTILISNKNHLKALHQALEQAGAKATKILSMSQGQKVSRVLAWTFLTPAQIQDWAKQRWPQKGPKLEK